MRYFQRPSLRVDFNCLAENNHQEILFINGDWKVYQNVNKGYFDSISISIPYPFEIVEDNEVLIFNVKKI